MNADSDFVSLTRWVLWGGLFLGLALGAVGLSLGGGCPQRNLVKTGSGDLKALVTLLVTALAAVMTLRGAFAPWRAEVRRRAIPAPHWLAGIAVGLLIAGAFALTGHIGFLAEHPETLEPAWVGTQSRRPEGLSFVAPIAQALDLLTLWRSQHRRHLRRDAVPRSPAGQPRLRHGAARVAPARLHPPARAGIASGRRGPDGVRRVTALGCTLGNGVTGVAMLSAGALLATAGSVAGALAAMQLRMHHEAYAPAVHASPS